MPRGRRLILGLSLLALCGTARAEAIKDVQVDPASVKLSGPNARFTLLVTGRTDDGRVIDLTSSARYRTLDPKVAAVTDKGVVLAVADGSASIQIEAAGRTLKVPVLVEGSTRARHFNFENDIVPILSKFGCNASGCHGKAEGQNGFKLSVFGFDPPADFAALTKEDRGRRVFPSSPEYSLLLRKVSGQTAHGGGVRIRKESIEYDTLRAWIAAGTPYGRESDPKVEKIRVEPKDHPLAMRAEQQLRVIATYSDGREIDITAHAKFQSNNDAVASVSENGLITAGDVPGDVAVMAGYMGSVAVFRAVVPRAERIEKYPDYHENNFIDALVLRKLKTLNIAPSDPCDDADYLRRAYLDVIGTLPTNPEARDFLADRRPDKRARLVEDLLKRPEFADYWALKWADLLRVDRQVLGHKRAYAYYQWIRDSLAENKPLDRFTRELLTAEGPLQEVGPANFYKVVGNPGDEASTLSQVFLGVRIACAQCHHHPFDRWSQTDYYGMQAFVTQVTFKPVQKSEVLVAALDAPTKHPRTGDVILAHALGTKSPDASPPGDRRRVLADWMTAPNNPYFARNLANRTWAHFMGRGLVEPVDDVRATNPPTNPELLDALAKNLIDSKFDFRQLIRTITASRAYQSSSRPNATNEKDEQNYSRALLKRIEAEVLLDMVCQTTDMPEKFPGVPAGSRAIQLWDSGVSHYFLKTFGRPVRASACECERNQEASVAQVLHLMNSPQINAKLTHEGGAVARLVKEIPDDAKLAEELYLTFYSRLPSEKEKKTAVEHLSKDTAKRRQAAEDLAWSMMNSTEFVFNH
jgi:hypothetical protein